MSLDNRTNVSLTGMAYNQLLSMILNGKLNGGAILQERRLAEELGLSRTPLREALGRLEGEGYVTRQGRNVLVTIVSTRSIFEILNVRELLEKEAVRLATGNVDLDRLGEIKQKIEQLTATTTDAHHWAVDDDLHQLIVESSGNKQLIYFVEELRNKTKMFGRTRIPERFEPGRAEHLAIIAALEDGNAKEAQKEMCRHLGNVKRSIVEKIMSDG